MKLGYISLLNVSMTSLWLFVRELYKKSGTNCFDDWLYYYQLSAISFSFTTWCLDHFKLRVVESEKKAL